MQLTKKFSIDLIFLSYEYEENIDVRRWFPPKICYQQG